MNTLTRQSNARAYPRVREAESVRDDWMDLARRIKSSGKTAAVDPRGMSGTVTLATCVKQARFWHRCHVFGGA